MVGVGSANHVEVQQVGLEMLRVIRHIFPVEGVNRLLSASLTCWTALARLGKWRGRVTGDEGRMETISHDLTLTKEALETR